MTKSLFDVLACQCGKRFRSISAEAVHRHNFPILCRRPKEPQPRPGETLIWKRERDGEHNGRPCYDYRAMFGDREYWITWTHDRGFGISAYRRLPNGDTEGLGRCGIVWCGSLRRCKARAEQLEIENGK